MRQGPPTAGDQGGGHWGSMTPNSRAACAVGTGLCPPGGTAHQGWAWGEAASLLLVPLSGPQAMLTDWDPPMWPQALSPHS